MTLRRPACNFALTSLLAGAIVLVTQARAPAEEEMPGGKARTARPGSQWDELRKAVLGFSDLVGRVSARKLTYWHLPPLTDVRGRIHLKGKSWRFENMTADICGGRVSSEARIDFLEDGVRRFRLDANVAGAKLEEVTRFFNYPVMGGDLSGRLRLNATSEKKTLHGRAEFHLRNADLGKLPLALKAVSFIFLGFPQLQEEKISQADGHATLTPRGLVFQDLSLRSETGTFSIEAERNGTVSYKGEANIYFRPVFGTGVAGAIPILPELLKTIRERGGRVRVTGSIYEPKFKWAAFR